MILWSGRSPGCAGGNQHLAGELDKAFFHRPIDAADFTTVHHDPARPRPEDLTLIYSDTALGTRLVERFGAWMPASSTSQPSLVAAMLELLDLTPGLKVLEIGAGTGYNAALLAELVGDQRLVITVDVAEDVVAQTRRLLAGAGYPGSGCCAATASMAFPSGRRWTASWPRWAARTCPRSGQRSSPRTAGCWCRWDTLVGTRCSCSGGGMADCAGRVARWSGFMDARGQLHADRPWSMGIAQPDDPGEVGEREPWPGFGAYETDPGPDDPVDEQDFLFYLSLVDWLEER